MQVPILSGIYTSEAGDFRSSYPVNMVPVAMSNGISTGYLRPADGAVSYGTGPGVDRGAIVWNDECYRVMGTKLCKIAAGGALTVLGDVGAGGQVRMVYSFDRLAIASGGNLFYWNGTTLTQVTDPDIGTVLDVDWVDGYFMTTDGEFLVITELTDPTAVNPLKYGSSEIDPDPINAVIKVRNEPHAVNRYTIEAFDNIGGDNFPFQRINGAQIQKGAVGSRACCLFMDAIVFVGSGRNEQVSVYIGANGQTQRIATREIDKEIAKLTAAQLADVIVESRVGEGFSTLYVHLPTVTLAYDAAASAALSQPVWYYLSTSIDGIGAYRARSHVWCYGKWLVGDPSSASHGYLTDTLSTHYGSMTGWKFETSIMYNEGRKVSVHELELVVINGRTSGSPVVWTSYSDDGVTWSMEHQRPAGQIGQRTRRLSWLRQGLINNWRVQRFRGTSDAHVSVSRLEARLEPLNV